MSKIEGGTIRERLARLEVLMCNHLEHHRKHERWIVGIGIVVVAEFIVQVFPELIKLLG